MMTEEKVAGIAQIGETAGAVWRSLDEHGPMSLAKLVERVGGNRDLIMQAVGWLAREGKVEIAETKRGRIVSLVV
ncbi:MAG: winged helix-turn-helix domain-containing protein [Pirellulaceae bacterium]|nr:winged helix-turn-helix domain-containing protein [Pirellulaceae bacterium]